MKGAYVMNLGLVPYGEAWELQRSLAGAVSQGAIPDTILLLEHPPTVTTGRRTEEGELHIPDGAEVEIVETDRGGKSTFHGPGQLVCYPIFDLKRHGQDVKRYCRDLEEALILTLAKLGVEGERIDGLTGVWLTRPPRKIASIGIHIAKWVTTHGYALNVDLDPAPFTQWITACGLEDAAFTTVATRARPAGDRGRDARPGARGARGGVRARAGGAAGRRAATASGRSRCTPSSQRARRTPAKAAALPRTNELCVSETQGGSRAPRTASFRGARIACVSETQSLLRSTRPLAAHLDSTRWRPRFPSPNGPAGPSG